MFALMWSPTVAAVSVVLDHAESVRPQLVTMSSMQEAAYNVAPCFRGLHS